MMKFFGAILTVIVFGIIGFIATLALSFSRDAEFYGSFIPISTFGLIVFTILAIYGKLKNKGTKICATVFLSISIVSLIAHEGYRAYLSSLEVVSTQDVDLTEYAIC
jgi:phosphate transport system substrate-binding protein